MGGEVDPLQPFALPGGPGDGLPVEPLDDSGRLVRDHVEQRLRQAGVTPMDSRMYAPHYVPEDSRLVQTLLGNLLRRGGPPPQ